MATLTLVVNPTAGRGSARRLLPFVVNEFVAGLPEHRLQVVQSTDYAEAERSVTDAVDAAGEGDFVAVMGGDGMLHLGVNAAAGSAVPLGMIPAGTGNDMCRGFGLPYANPVHAAKVIVAGHTQTVDLMQVQPAGRLPRHVGSVVASGFDALANQRANAMAWPRNNLRYALAALAELAVFRPLDYVLTVDGVVERLPAMLVAVGNGSYFGGGMKICPDADPADGLLDLTIVHPVGRATLLQLLPRMFNGSFVRHRCVERRRVREITVEVSVPAVMGDGEELGPPPFRATCAAGALRLFTPDRPLDVAR